MMTSPLELRVVSQGERLDMFLAAQEVGLTRSRIRRLIDAGNVLLNNSIPKPSQKLRPGDVVWVKIPEPEALDMVAEDIPLKVLYQDADLVVVDKPVGLSVHPGPGHPTGTLVNALLTLCPDLGSIGDVVRPGIVHRLDIDTSGIMVVAKTETAHHHLSKQLAARSMSKVYLALAVGHVLPTQGKIEAPIGRDRRNRKRMAVVEGGRESVTVYEVIKTLDHGSLLKVRPKTGRTHQIRAHFASIGHPLLGDKLYGKSSPLLPRQFLHAYQLGFEHPKTGAWMELTAPIPADLSGALECLETELVGLANGGSSNL